MRPQTHFSDLEPLSKSLRIHGTASSPRACTRQCCVLPARTALTCVPCYFLPSDHRLFFPHLINAELMTPHRPAKQAKNVKHLKPLQLVCSNCLWGTRTCYKHRERASNGKDYVRCGMRHRKSFALFGVRYVDELLVRTPDGYGAINVSITFATCFLVLGMLNACY